MRVKQGIAALVIAGIATTGCGAATNHDSLNPAVDIRLQWWRVETPPSTVTEFFACFGTTGIWLDQGDGNISNVQNDPMCPKGGTNYQLVSRNGSDPAVYIGTYSVPPDATGKYSSTAGGQR